MKQFIEGGLAIGFGLVVTCSVVASFAWVTLLPTLGLLWCFGVLK